MEGTYGWDTFSKVLLLIGILFLPYKYTFLAGIAVMIFAFVRTLSKNFEKRYREEAAFENWMRSIQYKFQNMKAKHQSKVYERRQKKNFVIVTCPECSQKLRLPRHKGNIIVTCKKCSHQFKART